MQKINFFTPVKYNTSKKSTSERLLEKIDNYFFLGGKKAYVIKTDKKSGIEKVVLSEYKPTSVAKKVASYFTIGIPLFMMGAKFVLRFRHKFKKIDPKVKLEKDLDVSEETIVKIQNLWPTILENNDEVVWLSKGTWLVFKLKDNPNLVFKIVRGKISNSEANDRYKNMVKAREVCLAHNLALLKIPKAKKIQIDVDGEMKTIIVEENLDIDANESRQFEHFYTHADQLKETARQLATFIAFTGFNDVTPRNIPIINESEDYTGPHKIALIDLEHMKSVAHGFVGDDKGNCGLINCMPSEELIDIVIDEAYSLKAAFKDGEEMLAKEKRLKQIKSDKKLKKFYKENCITTGYETIDVDLDSLELDLDEDEKVQVPAIKNGSKMYKDGNPVYEEETIKMREICKAVKKEINFQIERGKKDASIKRKRRILLNVNIPPLQKYGHLEAYSISLTKKEKEELVLHRIIQALIDKGYIFKLEKVNGHGYFIQA